MSEQLLRVKKHRESTAANEVVRCRRHLEQCAHALEQARRTVGDYTEWRRQREGELFESFREQLVQLNELENFNMHIGLLREREAELHNEVLEATKVVQDAGAALSYSQQQHIAAVRAKEKFQMFIDIQRQLEHQEQERREELELEEFTPPEPLIGEEVES